MAKLTVKQASERAGVSAQLIYQWCSEGRLPHYRLGGEGRRGKILIEDSDLDAFLASQKVSAGTPAKRPPQKRPFKHVVIP